MADEKGPPASKEALRVNFQYKEVSPRSEEEILSFWKDNKIFEKSLAPRQAQGKKHFVFFEGPPTANGTPGVHHVEARSFKDVILRYKTMRGFFAPRRAGWDTHGLPVEVEVEKKLGLKSKKDIEGYGVAEFNKKCKESVWQYRELWEKLTDRMGFWIDMEHPYVTYENSYIESLWEIIKEFWVKKLLYEDYKVIPWCARCGTALSSHELAQGYEKIKEDSVYIKFKIKGENKNRTSFLVWTTTPWTLPGNVALAVNPKIDYVTVELESSPGEWLILAESRLFVIAESYKVINRAKGKNLAGMEYEPLYKNNAPYRVVTGDFVEAEDGSGIVHIAPAFGEDDFQISKKENLPVLLTTEADGLMRTLGQPWDKMWFKKADFLIAKDLKERGLLFKKESYEHDYPFCWRCKTPLMYFARQTWWVDVNKVRLELIANNQKINWHPEHIKNGRFGEWLKEKKNWAFSRERYWGTPLPVWRCEKCKKVKAVGSLKELDELDSSPTELIVMRHGEVPHNIKDTTNPVSPESDKAEALTEKGRADVKAAAKKLKREKIDTIVSSPSHRAKETANIIAKELGMPESSVAAMPELYDVLIGGFEGVPIKEYEKSFPNFESHFTEKPKGAENFREIRSRMMKAAFEIRKKYPGKRILVVSHGHPIWILMAALDGFKETDYKSSPYLKPGEFCNIHLHNWPYNDEGELDLHKPYIDEIKLRCPDCKAEMARVPEVVDVWFDSGSMPFAAGYYPDFYPADYITEAVDQTRGWFYNLLAIGTLLGKGTSYKNVISLGHVLDKNGKKMSKSLGNIVDPMELMGKYGADPVRWYFFTVNQPWDAKLFKEEDVRDAERRFLMILWNSFVYWRTYASEKSVRSASPKLVINKWLLVKWNSVLSELTRNLESYDIVSAARKIENFVVEDLSRWYIRRIREHMKPGNKAAGECGATLGRILQELSKALAPFTPFIAEGIYKGLDGKMESVHLEDWHKAGSMNLPTGQAGHEAGSRLLENMDEVRKIVSKGLEARQIAGIKIRQPLAGLKIKNKLDDELLDLIKGEVNVKKVSVAKDLKEEVELDTEISEVLKEEGLIREFIRQVQDFRKELRLTPQEKVGLFAKGSPDIEKILKKHHALVEKEITISEFIVGKIGEGKIKEISLGAEKAEIGINHAHHVKIKNA